MSLTWQYRLRQLANCVAVVATDTRALRGLLTWPRFSFASYQLVADLDRHGVVPGTVIDVGANVGQFAVAAAHCFPRAQIHAFEAVPAVAETLRGAVRRLPNVTVHVLALGAREGELEIHLNADSRTSSPLPLAGAHRKAFPKALEQQLVRVRVTTLDAAFEGQALAAPLLLKLDVQGFEAEVLRGAPTLLRRVRWVVLEASFSPMYEGEALFLELVAMMAASGFRFVRPVGWLISPQSGEILQMDALFEATGT